ncbi:hypothetical protein ACHAQH_008133 [Verticillium albo-atrum]
MACGSGCCGGASKDPVPSVALPVQEPTPTPEPVPEKIVGEAANNVAIADSCCNDDGNALKDECKPSVVESVASASDVDDCCAPRPKAKPADSGPGCQSGCCSSPPAPAVNQEDTPDCCEGKKSPCCDTTCIDRLALRECQADRFSIAEEKPACSASATEIVPSHTLETNIEKGIAGREHVILSISGMTCTGCETKLKRTLATLHSVSNLKTSLVLSRAEFDLDLSSASIADIKKHLERTTEFTCEKVSNEGASLDFLYPADVASIINGSWPKGVKEITSPDKKTVRVEFDPKIIGARDLTERGWDSPMTLAPPRGDPTLDAGSKHVRNVGFMTLLSAILTIPVLIMAWAPLPEREMAYASASLALATLVQFVVAGPFYPKALKSLIFSRVIEMDLLIVLSTSAAYIFSVVAFGYLAADRPLSTGEFFETSTLLVTLIMVGRYVAALARQKAVESISIRSLQAPSATILDDDGNEQTLDARLLQFGDVFRVAPDSKVPTDGTVISGSSELDESMITGESRPVEKYTGSSVIAGSINGSGTLTVRLTRLPGDNTISTIAGMVDEAKLSKPRIQDIADRVAAYFVPVVVALASITFIIWVAVGITVRHQSGSEAAIQAITYAITVLIVSCPCAIGLAVPMVVVIASGVAAERGVIFKSAESIEVAYKTSHVVFDKTGTLTQGKLSVVRREYVDDDPARKSLLAGLLSSIKHPVSVAVAAQLSTDGVKPSSVVDAKVLTGKGVEGSIGGLRLRAGNSRWLGLSENLVVQSVLAAGYTAFCFTVNDSLVAVYGLEDSLRPDALSTVERLKALNVTVHILSGDDDGAVRSIASQLDIAEPNIRSRCTPGDKQAYIQDLLSTPTDNTSKKPKKPVVMFCGDGTNDAVALAQATIGVHMNEGTDVAKSAADVVLMRPALGGIVTAMVISKKSIHRIAFNFGWSFVYNTFAVLLGAGAFVRARIPPEFAGLGELVSVLPVIAAAVMLRWAKV